MPKGKEKPTPKPVFSDKKKTDMLAKPNPKEKVKK